MNEFFGILIKFSMKKKFLALTAALMMLTSGCKKTEPVPLPPQNGNQPAAVQTETPEPAAQPAETPVQDPNYVYWANTAITHNGIEIPAYTGEPVISVHDDIPYFIDEGESYPVTYIYFSPLDDEGRCGEADSVVGPETLPLEDERGDISSIHPTGWYEAKESDVGPNRGHLLMWALIGDQSNVKENLVTMTSYMNQKIMLQEEKRILNYIYDTRNHVRYRVTPFFGDGDVTCHGVLMEVMSVENPDDLMFCRFVYNIDPEYECDYFTGLWSKIYTPEYTGEDIDMEIGPDEENPEAAVTETKTFILNTASKKFHNPDCSAVGKISDQNRSEVTSTHEQLVRQGYDPCGICKP